MCKEKEGKPKTGKTAAKRKEKNTGEYR